MAHTRATIHNARAWARARTNRGIQLTALAQAQSERTPLESFTTLVQPFSGQYLLIADAISGGVCPSVA
jgi:hypothetical protein